MIRGDHYSLEIIDEDRAIIYFIVNSWASLMPRKTRLKNEIKPRVSPIDPGCTERAKQLIFRCLLHQKVAMKLIS